MKTFVVYFAALLVFVSASVIHQQLSALSAFDNWKSVVEKLVHDTQDKCMHLDNAEKADLIQKELQIKCMDQQFYVIVSNDGARPNKFAYSGNEDQMVVSLNRGSCNIIVYHSRVWAGASETSRNRFVREVDSCRSDNLGWSINFQGYIDNLRTSRIQNTGMVALIHPERNAQVRSVNCKDGPGKWIKIQNDYHGKFDLIAGFK